MNDIMLKNVVQYILLCGYTEISVYSNEINYSNGMSLKYFCFDCYEPSEGVKRSIRVFC